MPIVMYPLSIRRKALQMYSHGSKPEEIAAQLGCGHFSVKGWVQKAGVGKNSRLTDAEIDEKIQNWGRAYREKPLAEDAPGQTYRQKERKDLIKFGPDPDKLADQMEALGGADKFETLRRIADREYAREVSQVSDNNTAEKNQEHFWAGLAWASISRNIDILPAFVTTTDVTKIFELARKNKGLDKERPQTVTRIDLSILNGKVRAPGPVIDAEEMPKKRGRPKKITSTTEQDDS